MVKNKINKKRKIDKGRIIDLLLLIYFPIISVLALYNFLYFSTKYTLYAIAALVCIFFIYLISCICRGKIINFIKRILMIIICMTLTFAYVFSGDIKNGIKNFTSSSDSTTTTTMNLITLKDSYIQSLTDMEGASIGYLNNSQKENSTEALKKIKNEIPNINYTTASYTSTQSMIDELYSSRINSILIEDNQLNAYKENNKNFSKEIKTIKKINIIKKSSPIQDNGIDITDKVFTLYLSASDETGKPANQSLSDMNMLLIVNPKNNTVHTISIPRDSYIPNMALDQGNDKLTHTGSSGIKNTISSIENIFQIKVDFYAKISFDSLIKMVDEIGGIDVDVKIDFCEQDENRSFKKKDMICLKKGKQHLNGKQALAYARHRHSYENQDLGRNDAQMRVIKGIMNKLLTTEGISKIDDVLKILPKYVITNFSDQQINKLIKKQIDEKIKWTFYSMSLNHGTPASDITASYPGGKLSVFYLDKKDIEEVNGLYNYIKKTPSLNKFEYHIDHKYSQYSTWKDNNNYKVTDNPISDEKTEKDMNKDNK